MNSLSAAFAPSSRRLVIGFDSWTGGARHFERLVPALARAGFELRIVHLGSWGSDPGRASRERIGDLEFRDISSFRSPTFPDVIAEENPEVVILLSTDTFAHRAFIRYCRAAAIPTMLLHHGLISVQAVDGGPKNQVRLLAQLRFVAARLGKALTRVWPTYAASLRATGAGKQDWLRFAQDVASLTLGRFTLIAAPDARTDVCCVFVDSDAPFAIAKYGFLPEQVIAVGNPDLIQFGLKSGDIASRTSIGEPVLRDVIYVDTGLMYTGTGFSSEKEFVDHMVRTSTSLMRQGFRLLLKPHPDHLRTGILNTLAEAGIESCSNSEFAARVQGCCACIVEPSTAAVTPALIGVPVFLANYGALSSQRYGTVLSSYPRARALRDVDAFSSELVAIHDEPRDAETLAWIHKNAGPLPADAMPDRVAAVVARLAMVGHGGKPPVLPLETGMSEVIGR